MAAAVVGVAGNEDVVVRHRNGDPLDNRASSLDLTEGLVAPVESGVRRSGIDG